MAPAPGSVREQLAEIWPMFGVTVRTPRIELRLPTDEEILQLGSLAADGVHRDEFRDISFPWEHKPADELQRNMLQHHWNLRAEWTPDRWCLCLAVFVDGEPVGCQDLAGRGFAVKRTVGTGSWLGARHHGRGIGTEMRHAVLHLGFVGLGAQRAVTSYFDGNSPSERVSAKLGYESNGYGVQEQDGTAITERFLMLERSIWEPGHRTDIELEGVDACRSLLGADARS